MNNEKTSSKTNKRKTGNSFVIVTLIFIFYILMFSQVAKSAVLAFIDPESKEASYLVINFQNVSDRA